MPSQNAQYDLGSAEYKIRHLFLSDNSLWLGDEHKIDTADGKMRFKKRKKDKVPKSIIDAYGGDAVAAKTDVLDTIFGIGHNKTLNDMTIEKWLQYAKTKNIGGKGIGNVEIDDLYNTEAEDFEAQVEAISELPKATDSVLGGVKTGTGLSIDDSGVISLDSTLGKWTKGIGDNIYKNSGYIGIGITSPEFPLHISSNSGNKTNSNLSGKNYTVSESGVSYDTSQWTGQVSIRTSNYIWASAFFAGSDSRIKKDITIINDDTALKQVNRLESKQYYYIDPDRKQEMKTIGFIAQEVKEVLPNAVTIQKKDKDE